MFYGKIQALSVRDVLDNLWDLIPQSIISVIRSIDSTRSPQAISRILDSHKIRYRTINSNVCLTKNELRDAVSTSIFTGFDEVWIIEGEPIINLLSVTPVTSDASDFSSKVPPDVIDEANAIRCWLLLGDGCGLNYLSFDKRIYNKIRDLGNVRRMKRKQNPPSS